MAIGSAGPATRDPLSFLWEHSCANFSNGHLLSKPHIVSKRCNKCQKKANTCMLNCTCSEQAPV